MKMIFTGAEFPLPVLSLLSMAFVSNYNQLLVLLLRDQIVHSTKY